MKQTLVGSHTPQIINIWRESALKSIFNDFLVLAFHLMFTCILTWYSVGPCILPYKPNPTTNIRLFTINL